jgi:AcrR family transcriptional regulator
MAQLNDIEKRRVIIGEARKLFLRFGFSKTSMEDIAHQCNIAKPTLYYYYTNKEAIFDAIVSEEAENFLKKLDHKLNEDLPADRKLLLFMNIVYEHLNLYAKELSKMPEMLCESSPHGRPVVKKIRENFRFLLGKILQEGAEKGIFSIADHESHLNALALMISFMNLDWMQKNAEPTRRQTLESVTEILLNGLRKEPKC